MGHLAFLMQHFDPQKHGSVGVLDFAAPLRVMYRCLSTIALSDGVEIGATKILRSLAPDEIVEAVDEPCEEPVAKVQRIKVVASKDGQVGYTTIEGNKGTVYLERLSLEQIRELDPSDVPAEMH